MLRSYSINDCQIMEFNYSALETVVVGKSVNTELPKLAKKLSTERIFLFASNSLSKTTGGFAELREALGNSYVGLFDQIGSHTPRSDVLAALLEVRKSNADLMVSLGGGSIIDACKAVQLALDQNVNSEEELLQYAQQSDGTQGPRWGDFGLLSDHSRVRQIAVPTTLSGAEYSNNAGVLNTQSSAKEGYRGKDLCPQCIVYDPHLAASTPEWLWLSTAIRSLDHAVEGFCSKETSPYLDAHFLHAISMFAESLPQVKTDPDNLQARSLNFQAVWLACCGLGTVSHGASHGIGYILGSLCGVPHGHTSCVMLPAVLKWNGEEFPARQKSISTALGKPELVASEAVKELVSGLQLPTSLRDVGVEQTQLDKIAEKAILHPVVRHNPRSLTSAEQVREILELAW